ncbi:MAG TPA: dihydroorotase [Patescibacteria group bacterium]|nr:dihydroorotase [Patescibacteria group bacterium]
MKVGETVELLEISRAWLVDPVAGREGPGEIVVRDGLLEAVTWLEGAEAEGIDAQGVVVAPGFLDLHVHLREPGNEDAETVASGLAAAAHGGFTSVCAMANTTPAADEPGVFARVRGAAAASGSPVELLLHGAVTVGRGGERLAALGELADAGAVGFSDDGSPVQNAVILRNALLYAGMLGVPVVEHAEDSVLTAGAEANEGYVASVLGLKGWPPAAEVVAAERAIALLAAVLPDAPAARLHLTHLSTAAALDAVRRAKAAGLPVTCDVTPHHLGFTDEWLAGARRWAWEAVDGAGRARDPWADGALVAHPYATACKVNPPLRSAEDAAATLAALVDRTADAVATDHAPHSRVAKEAEFGLAANGISGVETALGVLLAAVGAGRLGLGRAVEALTTGPAAVLGGRRGRVGARGLTEGAPADLVVFDVGAPWTVTAAALASRGTNTPLLGRELRGRVLVTVADGRLAYGDAEA